MRGERATASAFYSNEQTTRCATCRICIVAKKLKLFGADESLILINANERRMRDCVAAEQIIKALSHIS
jgi:hypothetical protein